MSRYRVRWQGAAMRLRWRSRVLSARWAWPESLAVAALGFALGLLLCVNSPLRHEVRALQGRVPEATASAVRPPPAAPVSDMSVQGTERGPADFLARFTAFLPTANMREQQLQTLHGLAGQGGVVLSRAEYSHADLAHLPGRRTTMQLTVRGDYPACRSFLHDLLVAMPNLGIDRVTMERAASPAAESSGTLDVRIAASLYYRGTAAGPPP